MKLIIDRLSMDEVQTVGIIRILGAGPIPEFCSLELPWFYNARNKSCIPALKYRGIRYMHPTRGKTLVILDVPGRTDIMMHPANFYKQLLGCVAPGLGFKDIDKDGHVDVTDSKTAMIQIYDTLPDEFIVEINNPNNTPLPWPSK